jgi:3-hydroxyisobutyrate dehydrogenase
MTIGYVGLGNMGGALARRLQLSHDLLVHDQDTDALNRACAAGSTPAKSLAEVGRVCETIFLCLPTPDHVRSVLLGADGIAAVARPGTVIIDQTTGDPDATRATARELAVADIKLIDAPVSGGRKGALDGTIAIMVGCEDSDFDRVLPVLSTISPNVFHAGPTGNGHVMKLVNNLISSVQRLLTIEGMTLAVKNGVEPVIAHQILVYSGGRNAYIENVLGPRLLKGDLASGFTLELAHKDVKLACQLGVDSGVPVFFGTLCREMYQVFMNELGRGAEVDMAAVAMDRRAGTSVIPVSKGRHQ